MDGVSFAALGFTLFLELFSLVDAYMYVHFLSLVRTIYHRSLSCAGVGCVPSAEMVVLGVGLLGTSRYRALPSFVSFVFSVFFRFVLCLVACESARARSARLSRCRVLFCLVLLLCLDGGVVGSEAPRDRRRAWSYRASAVAGRPRM